MLWMNISRSPTLIFYESMKGSSDRYGTLHRSSYVNFVHANCLFREMCASITIIISAALVRWEFVRMLGAICVSSTCTEIRVYCGDGGRQERASVGPGTW